MQIPRAWRIGVVSIICLVLGGLLFLRPSTRANAAVEVSPWLVTSPPTLEKIGDTLQANLPTTLAGGNQPCENREIIIRPKRILPVSPFLQSKQSHTSCVVNTAYGAVSSDGYLQRAGSTVFGVLRNNAGGSATLATIPYSSTGISIGGVKGYGNYLLFYDNLDTTLGSSSIYTGEVTHKLPAAPSSVLSDASGNALPAQSDSMSFSANGDWMVVDVPYVATVRVNTLSKQVLPFGDAISYNIGIGPAFRTAVSPDGRYVVVASKTFDIFRLYDLSTCSTVPATITTKVPCNSRDLLPLIKQKVAGFTAIVTMQFRSDYTLDMYVSTGAGATVQYSHHILTPEGFMPSGFQYLGLGDSFASGEGAYQYKTLTDTSTNMCHLSQRSYPYLISNELGYGEYESVACSGAKIDDLINITEDYNQKNSQAKGKEEKLFDEEILSNFLPGYRGQKRFIREYQPSSITLSAVGNDIGFSDKISRCLDNDTCYSSYEDRLEIVNEINYQFYRLTDMYNQLKSAGDPRVKIYVISYPQIGDPDGNCAANVHLNHDELVFANQLVSYLNSVIKTAAANAGVAYVDVEDALAGHKLCETDSWNVAVNGLTAGNDIANIPFVHGPIGNESFHPNALGQYLLKTKILAQTVNFTQPMPLPNPSAVLSDPQDSLPILNAPKSNRTTRTIRHYAGTDGGVFEYGKTWLYEYNPYTAPLKIGSKVQAWLNSDPVFLGEFTVAPDGSVTATGQLPTSIPTGWHTFHLYGKNTSDEDIDIFQTIYVSDGTGPCSVPSGLDADQDNIDDACDGFIDQPPIATEPESNTKPPENNPETVAGPWQGTDPTTQPTTATNTPIITATSRLSSNTLATTTPQVAAATTEPDYTPQSITESIPTAPPTPGSSPQTTTFFKLLFALLIISVLLVLIKTLHHPK